jgi:hypothetical protein
MTGTATAGSPAAAFGEVGNRFREAAASAGERVLEIGVAGARVRLRFAGDALADRMSEAFSHLAGADAPLPGLTIDAWDSAGSGVAPPLSVPGGLPQPSVDAGEVNPRRLWRDGRGRLAVWQPAEGSLSMVDLGAAHGWFWFHDAEALPFWEIASPLRLVLGWWLAARGTPLVHAGAVGRREEGLMLVGRGGSGKSTTSLACLCAPLVFAGDDYVVLEPSETPVVHSIYGSGKVDADNLHRLPALAGRWWNEDRLDREKAVVFVHRAAPGRMVRSLPVRAVAVPKVTGRTETTFRRIPPAVALAALAPSTILQITGSGDEALGPMAGLLRSVPSYALELGTEVTAIPDAVEALLDEAGR